MYAVRGVQQVEHVVLDDHAAQRNEIAVLLVLDLDRAPRILAASLTFAVQIEYVVTADHRERYLRFVLLLHLETLRILVVVVRKLVDLNFVLIDVVKNLVKRERESLRADSTNIKFVFKTPTFFLNCVHSSGVSVSALAITGMMFTLSCRLSMQSISICLSEWPDG